MQNVKDEYYVQRPLRRQDKTADPWGRKKHTVTIGREVRAANNGWLTGGSIIAVTELQGTANPAAYTMGTGSLPAVKHPGRGLDHPP